MSAISDLATSGNAGIVPHHHVMIPAAPRAHLAYIPGPRNALFNQLIEKGILDSQGRVKDEWATIPLPSLDESEKGLILNELNREFEIELSDGQRARLNMRQLMNAFVSRNQILSCRLIGGFVTHLLFSETDYAKKVFKRLGIEDLYDADLFPKNAHSPPDIDVRMQVDSLEMERLRDEIIMAISAHFPQNDFLMVKREAFTELCTIPAPLLMQLVSLKNSPIDWILYHYLPRPCVFTRDALEISLQNGTLGSPQASSGGSLQAFWDYTLRLTYAESPETIDSKGWWRYLDGIMKGFCSRQAGLEEILFAKTALSPYDLQMWINKHHPGDAVATFILILNAYAQLEKHQTTIDFQTLMKQQDIPKEKFTVSLIHKLLCKHNIPLPLLLNTIKVAAFFAYVRSSPSHVQIRSLECRQPVLFVNIGGFWLQLDMDIDDALYSIQGSDLPDSLATLFYQIYEPSEEPKEMDTDQLALMGIDLDTLVRLSTMLSESDQSVCRFIGTVALFSAPDVDKRRIAEKSLLTAATLVRESIPEFEYFIGKHVVPPLSAPNFNEKWIHALFQHGRNSEATAFELWEELPFDVSSFALIQKLAHFQPEYAGKIFARAPLERFPNEALACILACSEIEARTPEHEQLLQYLCRSLPQLLHKKPPRCERRNFSKQLYAFVERFKDQKLALSGLKRGFFVGAQQKACERLALSALFDDLRNSFTQAESTLKKMLREKVLTDKEVLTYVLKLYKEMKDYYDPEIFANVIALSSKPISPAEKRKLAKILIHTLVTQPHDRVKLTGIGSALSHLRESVPHALYRPLFIQCYLRKISLPLSFKSSWAETLHTWVCEEEPDFQMIYNILLNWEKQYCAEDVVEVKLALADAWKEDPKLSKRSLSLLSTSLSCLPNDTFYRVLGVCITQNFREGFELIDQLPHSPHEHLLEPVLACISSQSTPLVDILNWMRTTKFFDSLEQRERFKEVVQELFKDLLRTAIIEEKKIEWGDQLTSFTSQYIEDLKGIPQHYWDDFGEYFNAWEDKVPNEKSAETFFCIFLAFEKASIFKDHNPLLFSTYVATLRHLIVVKNRKVLFFLKNIERHQALCTQTTLPLLVSMAHHYLLEAARSFVTEPKESLPFANSVRQLYALSSESHNTLKRSSPLSASNLDQLEATRDFNLVEFLVNAQLYQEAKEKIEQLLDENHSNEYWQYSAPLITKLILSNEALFSHSIVQLLELQENTIFLALPAIPTANYLLEHCSEKGCMIAALLLSLCYMCNEGEFNDNSWEVIYRVLKGLEKYGKFRQAGKLVLTLTLKFDKIEDSLSAKSFIELIEVCLSATVRIPSKDKYYKENLILQINNIFLLLIKNKSIQGREALLPVLCQGLIALSRLDWDAFNGFVIKYMEVIAESTARGAKNCFILPVKECCEAKKMLIEMMIDASDSDHPFSEKISRLVGWYLIQFIQSPIFIKTTGLLELFPAMHRGLVMMSRLDFETFISLSNAYFTKLIVARRRHLPDEFPLPLEECFAQKKAYIEAMIDEITPDKKNLSKFTSKCIIELMKDPNFRHKRTDFANLLRACQEAASPSASLQ